MGLKRNMVAQETFGLIVWMLTINSSDFFFFAKYQLYKFTNKHLLK